MRKFSKRMLTWLLAAAMVFGLSGMTAFAEETGPEDPATPALSAEDEIATIDEEEEGLPESDHNYENNEDKSWTYTLEGAEKGVYVTFDSQTRVETNWDYIYLYDAEGNEAGVYTGTTLAGATVYIPTATFTIRLTSDSSTTYWGFKVTSVEAVVDPVDLSVYATVNDPLAPVYVGNVPDANVRINGSLPLVQGTDYTVEADTNTVGETVDVTITGIGDYTGTLTSHVYVYDEEHLEKGSAIAPDQYVELRQTANSSMGEVYGVSYIPFSNLDTSYAENITSITMRPVETDEEGNITGDTEPDGVSYPNAPTTITIKPGDDRYGYVSGNYLYFNRTAADPVVYVMSGHGYPHIYGSRNQKEYPQTQVYEVTVEAPGYEDTVGTVTYCTGTCSAFSIIIDEDGDDSTTEDQWVAGEWDAEELAEGATFANGSSQCGMTGFRTFTSMGISLRDLLEECDVEVSADDYFTLDTTDHYGNNFTYEQLFGTTRYFMEGIYTDEFADLYHSVGVSDNDAGYNLDIRLYLAKYALEHQTAVEPRIASEYKETMIYGDDLGSIEIPTEENTTFDSLVSLENRFRFIYGVALVQEDCEVTFDTQGGSDVESQTVLSHQMTSTENTTMWTSYWATSLIIYRGEGKNHPDTDPPLTGTDTITVPDDPTREGYVFAGWYTDEECTTGNRFDFTANDGTVDEDTTLYAKWVDEDFADLQSDHPYENNEDQSWTYTLDGAENGVYITFDDRTETEEGYDYIYIYDGENNLIGQYDGTALAGATLYIPTATFTVRLTSDSSATEWGFWVTDVEAAGDTVDLERFGSVNDPLDPVEVNGTPIAEVLLNGSDRMPLAEGTDYTITADTSKAGEMAEVTIEGIGKYTGTLTTHVFVSDENHRVITATDFDITSGEHDDADGDLNQTIIATITFSEDIALAHKDLSDDLLITIAGGDVNNTARTITYEVQNGNQLVITMVSTGSVAITSGWLSITDVTRTGILAADGQGYVYMDEQGGQIPTGIVVTNDMIAGTDAQPASTYVNVAHKANMRGMFFYQLVSIDGEGNETILVSTNGHAHDFYGSVDEASIANTMATSFGAAEGYTVTYTEGDTFFIVTADDAEAGENLAVRMVEIKATINEAHAPDEIVEEDGMLITRCSFCKEVFSEEPSTEPGPEQDPEPEPSPEPEPEPKPEPAPEPVPLQGLNKVDGQWGYYVDGEVDETYTGFASNENGYWYVDKGYVYFNDAHSSVYKDTTGKNGDKGVGSKGDWYYTVRSKVQLDFTGLANYKNENGWWYIRDGKVDFGHNGVEKNKNGWWYVTGGKVQFGFTGLANYRNSYGWWYIKGGKVDFAHNGVDKNKNGWWYVTGGKVQLGFTGLAHYKNKNGWWYINAGKVTFDYTGVAPNQNGSWYIRNSKVQFDYSGTVTSGGRTYTIVNGRAS